MELKVTFLCVVYVGDLAVTGGEDGMVISIVSSNIISNSYTYGVMNKS